MIALGDQVPLVTKTEFLLTLSLQYQADNNENKEKYQSEDYWLIQFQILQSSVI